jgi:putative endopeptidase
VCLSVGKWGISTMRRMVWVAGALFLAIAPYGASAQTADSRRAAFFAHAPEAGCGRPAEGTPFGQKTSDSQSGHGFDLANLDRSVKPCDDFFGFAEGGWTKNNPIPAAYSEWGTFNILHNHNEDVLHQILEEASKDPKATPGSNWQKIGDFYASCMDEPAIEAAGIEPLEPEFERIAAIHDGTSLQAEIARLQRQNINAAVSFGSFVDPKDSTRRIALVFQGGLGMPDRDYYTNEDEKSVQLRNAYVHHVGNMFKLLGDNDAAAASEAKAVVSIESSLAKASMEQVDLRDPDKIYHLMTLEQLKALTPHVDWSEFLKQVDSPAVSSMDVGQPDFLKHMDGELAAIPLADWKSYLRWQLVHAVATELPARFVDEDFAFFGRALTGSKELKPRWRRCVQAVDAHLGEALGQFYVQRTFSPEAKARATATVKNIITALRADLSTLDWMSAGTRQKAVEKLDAIDVKVGYPDKWRDYSKFKVERGPYVENARRGDEFDFAYDVAKIGKPVDRGEWVSTPPTVDAYYRPSMNDITFLAGILQPPFYDPSRDDAMNYGAIGAVIGHELTHGFDDQGAKFDAQGNLKNWWTDEDLRNFQERGDCIAKQFNGYEVEPGLHENGKLVEGESIADFGGLTIAYAALQKSFEGKALPAPIDGFKADQRFFLGWAQIWAANIRPELGRMFVTMNPHPVPRFRVNGPLSNMPAFSKAFECDTKSPMVRPAGQRCRIW